MNSSPLAQLRRANGYTQMDVAVKLGLSKRAIESYENGTRRLPAERFGDFAELYKTTIQAIYNAAYGEE